MAKFGRFKVKILAMVKLKFWPCVSCYVSSGFSTYPVSIIAFFVVHFWFFGGVSLGSSLLAFVIRNLLLLGSAPLNRILGSCFCSPTFFEGLKRRPFRVHFCNWGLGPFCFCGVFARQHYFYSGFRPSSLWGGGGEPKNLQTASVNRR